MTTEIAPIYLTESLESVFYRDDAAIFVNLSGGKDSLALANAVVATHRERGWNCDIIALHEHLGRAEWPQSLPKCKEYADRLGVTFVAIKRAKGDLAQVIEDRKHALAGETIIDRKGNAKPKPFWPSPSARYCTSYAKRDTADMYYRNSQEAGTKPKPFWPSPTARYCTSRMKSDSADKLYRRYALVISAEGIRALESDNRAKKHPLTIREAITSVAFKGGLSVDAAIAQFDRAQIAAQLKGRDQARLALTWYPIFEWGIDQVWAACGTSTVELEWRRALYRQERYEEAFDGWVCHPAYVMGNERLSCSLCIVFGSKNDLEIGAKRNPDYYWLLVGWEEETGSNIREDLSLRELSAYWETSPTSELEHENSYPIPPDVALQLQELYYPTQVGDYVNLLHNGEEIACYRVVEAAGDGFWLKPIEGMDSASKRWQHLLTFGRVLCHPSNLINHETWLQAV